MSKTDAAYGAFLDTFLGRSLPSLPSWDVSKTPSPQVRAGEPRRHQTRSHVSKTPPQSFCGSRQLQRGNSTDRPHLAWQCTSATGAVADPAPASSPRCHPAGCYSSSIDAGLQLCLHPRPSFRDPGSTVAPTCCFSTTSTGSCCAVGAAAAGRSHRCTSTQARTSGGPLSNFSPRDSNSRAPRFESTYGLRQSRFGDNWEFDRVTETRTFIVRISDEQSREVTSKSASHTR